MFWAMVWAQVVGTGVAYVSRLMHLIPEPVLKDFFTYNVAIISCPMLQPRRRQMERRFRCG